MEERAHTNRIIQYLLGQGVVAYQRGLARAVGDHSSGLLLSQFWYWAERLPQEREGWFYMTQEQIYEETVMTRREQETARKRLRELGVLEESKRGVPAKLWFRINVEAVVSLLERQACSQDGGIRQTRMAESAILESRNPPNKQGGIRQSIVSKNTAEITSKNSAADAPPAASKKSADSAAADLIQKLLDQDLNRADAIRLVADKPEECRRQLERLPFKIAEIGGEDKFKSGKGAYLRAAIEGEFAPPPSYKADQERRQKTRQRQQDRTLTEARKAHEARFSPQYRDYLRQREKELAISHSEAYSAFQTQTETTRRNLAKLSIKTPLEFFDTEEARLERFAEFFQALPDRPLLNFWQWDATQNSAPFSPSEPEQANE